MGGTSWRPDSAIPRAQITGFSFDVKILAKKSVVVIVVFLSRFLSS